MTRLARLVGLDAADAPRVGWLFVHSLCVGTFSSFLFCAGSAIFLGQFEADMLPWGYIASGLAGTLIIHLLGRLRGRLSFSGFLVAQLTFLGAIVLGLYGSGILLHGGFRNAVAFLLFTFVGPSLVVMHLVFWSLASRLFDLRQSKRFNPLVSTGEAMASIAGFFLIPLISPDETLHLLLPALAGLGGAVLVVVVLRRRFAADLREPPSSQSVETSETEVPRDRYFVLAATVTGLAVAAQYLVDFTFLSQLEERYVSAEQVAAFIGTFYGVVRVLDLLFKSLVSGRLVQLFGLRLALRVLPTALLVAATLALLLGSEASLLFLFVALTKLSWPVLRKSVFDPAFKVLYQPLPKAQSLRFQSRIDGGVRQLVTVLIGFALLLSSDAALGTRALLVGLILVVVAWIACTDPLYREYRKRLMTVLSTRDAPPLARSSFDRLCRWLADAGEPEQRQAMTYLAAVDPVLVEAIQGRLGPMTLVDLEREFGRQDDRALRCRTIELYAAAGGSEGERLLIDKLGFPDPVVHLAAIRGLVSRGYRAEGAMASRLRTDIEGLASDVAWNLAALCDLQAASHEEPQLRAVCDVLRSEIEALRRLAFLRLALLVDAGVIDLVSEGLAVDGRDGGAAKANALELLETSISDDLRPVVLALVDDRPAPAALKRLERFFPSERLGWRERLRAMMQRSPASRSLLTHAMVLVAIGESCEPGEVAEELLAHLFHPDPLLQEIAVVAIARQDIEQCRQRLTRLPVDTRKKLLPLVREARDEASPLPKTIYQRLRLLDTVEPFDELPEHVKAAVAVELDPFVLRPGDVLRPVDAEASLAVAFDTDDAPSSASLLSKTRPATARSCVDTHLLYLDGIRLRELVRRYLDLLVAVLQLRTRDSRQRCEANGMPSSAACFKNSLATSALNKGSS